MSFGSGFGHESFGQATATAETGEWFRPLGSGTSRPASCCGQEMWPDLRLKWPQVDLKSTWSNSKDWTSHRHGDIVDFRRLCSLRLYVDDWFLRWWCRRSSIQGSTTTILSSSGYQLAYLQRRLGSVLNAAVRLVFRFGLWPHHRRSRNSSVAVSLVAIRLYVISARPMCIVALCDVQWQTSWRFDSRVQFEVINESVICFVRDVFICNI